MLLHLKLHALAAQRHCALSAQALNAHVSCSLPEVEEEADEAPEAEEEEAEEQVGSLRGCACVGERAGLGGGGFDGWHIVACCWAGEHDLTMCPASSNSTKEQL